MTDYYDSQEICSADERYTRLSQALPGQLKLAKEKSPYFKEMLRDIEIDSINDPKKLKKLPVTRKSELVYIQKDSLPFGGMITRKPGHLKRIFQSPGPTYDPEGYGEDWWRTARAFYAAGFREGDIVHNSFSYHLTPAGAMLETGAAKIGCAVIPAGVGNSELQVKAIADIKPDGFSGTPSFLKILLKKAGELNLNISSLKKSIVGGEALPIALRTEIENYGMSCQQIYASADLGCIAYESSAKEGLIIEESLYVEIVRPGTNEPLPIGQVGEVVVTSFNPEYPLVRFGTGDLSAMLDGISPCGRTNFRLKGWMGRADQTTKVRGMFVHPKQIATIIERHPEIIRAKLIVKKYDDRDIMVLNCAIKNDLVVTHPSSFINNVSDTIQSVCKLRGEVQVVPLEQIPNDGKVIEDLREFE